MLLLAFLLLFNQSFASHRALDNDTCKIEIARLRLQLQNMQNQFLLGTWRLKYLKADNRYWINEHTKTRRKEQVADIDPNLLMYHHDCSEVYNSGNTTSGYYTLKPWSAADPFVAYCDMSEGGGWTVIQRRSNGKVNFNRGWDDYKSGFGLFQRRNDEYWLGNENIHQILAPGKYIMKVDLTDWNGEERYATYEKFNISDEKDKYRLCFGSYIGTAGDALSGGLIPWEQWSSSHNGMQFSTSDHDNDRYTQGSCAHEGRSGWWFNRCHAANLNGKYYRRGNYSAKNDNGVVWNTWRGWWYSLRFTSMKVRPLYYLAELGSGDYDNIIG
ncbi:LOW QUALITY PROTEIN: fibrinogen like 1B [Leucoraja erinacea]|uniref:LOW QUALITY PROTEIN: fibrinogen like 1B n=1 Tax=Leucoraja erinaceus TaxID=7782 RepID=UPI00245597F0|nr:LOW QUALITY PROTEIN: fibrinogen like 1B [Leucoraja erinacea]